MGIDSPWQFADADCDEPIVNVVTELLARTLIDADRRRQQAISEENKQIVSSE